MRRQLEFYHKRSPVGWVLLLILCAAAFWLGQAMYNAQADAQTTTIPNDLFATGMGTTPTPSALPDPTPSPDPDPSAQPSDADFNEEAEEVMMLKMVCLTFDDGPSVNTEEILRILQEYDVPATFFVTAQDMNLPYLELTKTIVEQGHQLALHSATHEYKKIYQSSSAFWLDMKELRQALEPYVDVESIHWLRFPGGSTNTVSHKYGGNSIMKTLIAETAEKGYEWIDWNVSAEDATSKHPNADQILKNIKNDANGRDICVVLMHDTKATSQTVKALPSIIEWFQEEGYHFLTVEQMYAEQHPSEATP